MKILYAVQATGNGHISRAIELLPYLKQYGEVDIFLSGNNSCLEFDMPVKYRSKGLSLHFNCNGGVDYLSVLRGVSPLRLRKEINDLPVENYDLVLNDFDYITAAACTRKKVPSIQFGHQASFQSSHTPRPDKKSVIGEYILKNYARATHYAGLHFEAYDDFIFTPIIRKEILKANPADKGYVTVYLPSYCEPELIELFGIYKDVKFEIFCFQTKQRKQVGNISLLPVSKELFTNSFIYCTGIITGGGFETPAEALHLGKKLMTIPICGHYEQQCNAAALALLGVTKLNAIDTSFKDHFFKWMNEAPVLKKDYSQSTTNCLNHLFKEVYPRLSKVLAVAG